MSTACSNDTFRPTRITDSQPNDNIFVVVGVVVVVVVVVVVAVVFSGSLDAVASAAACAHSFSSQLAKYWLKKPKLKLYIHREAENRNRFPFVCISFNTWQKLVELLRNVYAAHIHIPFNGPLSRTIRVSRYQKGKTNLDFTEARDSQWQWHQLGHMQVCISLQTDKHTSTPPLFCFLQAGCRSCRPTNSVKALKARISYNSMHLILARVKNFA